jgi:hypothetical protein
MGGQQINPVQLLSQLLSANQQGQNQRVYDQQFWAQIGSAIAQLFG